MRNRRKEHKSGTDWGTSEDRAGADPGEGGDPGAEPCASEGTGEGPGLEVVQQDDPIRAYKVAVVALINGAFGFIGYGSAVYGIESLANCEAFHTTMYYSLSDRPKGPQYEWHTAPIPECTCGYYAIPQSDFVLDNSSLIGLEVDLAGTIIECERGWRAQHQRVMAVLIPDCHYCPALPTKLAFVPYSATRYYGGTTSHVVSGETLRPLCDRHIRDEPWITPSELAAKLGTEVRLAHG